jgi:hypothetical protein
VFWLAAAKAAMKGGCMSEQENERNIPASDDPDVEGHRVVPRSDEAAESEAPGRRENEEGDDVEAHRVIP